MGFPAKGCRVSIEGNYRPIGIGAWVGLGRWPATMLRQRFGSKHVMSPTTPTSVRPGRFGSTLRRRHNLRFGLPNMAIREAHRLSMLSLLRVGASRRCGPRLSLHGLGFGIIMTSCKRGLMSPGRVQSCGVISRRCSMRNASGLGRALFRCPKNAESSHPSASQAQDLSL